MAGGDHGADAEKLDAFDRAGKRRSECLFSKDDLGRLSRVWLGAMPRPPIWNRHHRSAHRPIQQPRRFRFSRPQCPRENQRVRDHPKLQANHYSHVSPFHASVTVLSCPDLGLFCVRVLRKKQDLFP